MKQPAQVETSSLHICKTPPTTMAKPEGTVQRPTAQGHLYLLPQHTAYSHSMLQLLFGIISACLSLLKEKCEVYR